MQSATLCTAYIVLTRNIQPTSHSLKSQHSQQVQDGVLLDCRGETLPSSPRIYLVGVILLFGKRTRKGTIVAYDVPIEDIRIIPFITGILFSHATDYNPYHRAII